MKSKSSLAEQLEAAEARVGAVRFVQKTMESLRAVFAAHPDLRDAFSEELHAMAVSEQPGDKPIDAGQSILVDEGHGDPASDSLWNYATGVNNAEKVRNFFKANENKPASADIISRYTRIPVPSIRWIFSTGSEKDEFETVFVHGQRLKHFRLKTAGTSLLPQVIYPPPQVKSEDAPVDDAV